MHLVRGALSDIDDDRRVTRRLARITERTDEPSLRVWTPPQQVAFGRRDSSAEGYGRAREISVDHGYTPVERSVGGSAVAYTGTTVAFAVAVPTEGGRGGIESRYRDATSTLARAIGAVGAAVTRGEPDGSFCPGEHSIQGTGKIAGIAQRVRRESALVGGCVIVSKADQRAVSAVLEPVYAELGIPFDSASVGSIEEAGGRADTERVIDAIETAFVDGREVILVSAEGTLCGELP
jgi:lipoate-protein ligase A